MRALRPLLILMFVMIMRMPGAYPEFQTFSQKRSGRIVDCSMCHVSGDGPYGTKPGQVSALDANERELLTAARNASQPGQKVQSPILNAFGNHIVEKLGGDRIRDLVKEPEKLADALGYKSDLDGDGIPDAQEYLDGTDPLSSQSGTPHRLFIDNVSRYWFDILMIIVTTAVGFFGLNNLFRWFTLAAEAKQQRL